MPWERRAHSKRQYYTRTRRRNGRRVREYVGAGIVGQIAAALDELERQDRERARQALEAEKQRGAVIDGVLDLGADVSDAMLSAHLLAAGYRRVDRHWRKRRAC